MVFIKDRLSVPAELISLSDRCAKRGREVFLLFSRNEGEIEGPLSVPVPVLTIPSVSALPSEDSRDKLELVEEADKAPLAAEPI